MKEINFKSSIKRLRYFLILRSTFNTPRKKQILRINWLMPEIQDNKLTKGQNTDIFLDFLKITFMISILEEMRIRLEF